MFFAKEKGSPGKGLAIIAVVFGVSTGQGVGTGLTTNKLLQNKKELGMPMDHAVL